MNVYNIINTWCNINTSKQTITRPRFYLFIILDLNQNLSFELFVINWTCPQQLNNNPVRKLPVPGNSGDFVAAVFRPENFRIFSDDFRSVPAEKHRKLTGIHRKKSGRFPVGILLPCSSDFQCFPAGFGDFPASFLQDPGGSGGRNRRPGYALCDSTDTPIVMEHIR